MPSFKALSRAKGPEDGTARVFQTNPGWPRDGPLETALHLNAASLAARLDGRQDVRRDGAVEYVPKTGKKAV
jgi:hypothetical protein